MWGKKMKINILNDGELKRDIVEWDVVNWGRALQFIDDKLKGTDLSEKKVLCIGERRGGMSLYFSVKGAGEVVCSDITQDFSTAKALHKKYGVKAIKYLELDASDEMPEMEYDIICFKSVLGAIGYGGNVDNQYKAIRNMHHALKPGGVLCFMENLQASPLHMFLRRVVSPKDSYRKTWRYLAVHELKDLCGEFSKIEIETFGFWGCMGINEALRRYFGKLDTAIDWCCPKNYRYIASVYAVK